MLLELKVKNFAIIENINLKFKSGLNVLSGETGAGKSVLLKSLSLLMGAKSSSESIRSGAEQASIEGLFDLSHRKDIAQRLRQLGIEVEDQLLSVRRVLSDEKSRVYLNEHLSTLQALRDVVSPLLEVTSESVPLIEMTGQHENRNLTSKVYHLDLLDSYAGGYSQRQQLQVLHEQRSQLLQELSSLETKSIDREQRIDFVSFQIQEITKIKLNPETDSQLELEIKKNRSSARLQNFVDSAEATLSGDDDAVITRLKSLVLKANEFVNLDPSLQVHFDNLKSALLICEDVSYELGQYAKDLQSDDFNLEQAEARLSQIRKLQKKYGPEVEDIQRALMNFKQELKLLENFEQESQAFKHKIDSINIEALKIAKDLHKKRTVAAATLSDSVNAELSELNMKGVRFLVQINTSENWGPTGISDLEFMTQNSAKETAKSLGKAASGGELSRILLSLKRVIGSSDQPRTYLFDEVDTGVSGPTAEKVGRKLKSIAKGQQVICVTHLPQVAACGDVHFFISKDLSQDQMAMSVVELKTKSRVEELARLISGEKISKTSLAHAEELLKEARI